MKISHAIALAVVLAGSASAASAFDLNEALNAASALKNGNKESNQAAVTAAAPAAGLLNTLGTQLKISPEQAIGGAGAMLGLAKNKLPSGEYSQLTQQVPGLDKLSGNEALAGLNGLSGLLGEKSGSKVDALNQALGNVKTTSDMNNAFSALGMNSQMVGQFAPVILQYLGQQGVGGSVLQNLSGIWGAS